MPCLAISCWLSRSLQSTRGAAGEGNLPAGQQLHGRSSWATREADAGDDNNHDNGGSGDGNDATPSDNPGVQHLSPPGGGGAVAAVRWGAGLSEQVQTVLNHGRAKVDGVVTRYSHLQHVQVRYSHA